MYYNTKYYPLIRVRACANPVTYEKRNTSLTKLN